MSAIHRKHYKDSRGIHTRSMNLCKNLDQFEATALIYLRLLKLIYNILFVPILLLMGIIISESIGRLLGLGKPLLYTKDPLVGYRLQPNQNNRRRKNSTVTTDYEGFRVNSKVQKDSFKEIIDFLDISKTDPFFENLMILTIL